MLQCTPLPSVQFDTDVPAKIRFTRSMKNEARDKRAQKASRYRAQAAQYRFEASILRHGPSRDDRIAFAEQWEGLADELDAQSEKVEEGVLQDGARSGLRPEPREGG